VNAAAFFAFYALHFMVTKKGAETGLCRALWCKKRRVLSVPKFLERDQKIWFFRDFSQKSQKSDFPRKRSQNPKNTFGFVTIKKNFFFWKLFRGFEFWTYFCMSIFETLRKVSKKWIFLFFL
jgi:hypothetical protein